MRDERGRDYLDRGQRKRLVEQLVHDLEQELDRSVQHVHNLMRWYVLMQDQNGWFPFGVIAELQLWAEQDLRLLRLKIEELEQLKSELS